MSSKEIQELEGMFRRVLQEESPTKEPVRPLMKPKSARSPTEESKEKPKQQELDDEDSEIFHSLSSMTSIASTSSNESDCSTKTTDFLPLLTANSDEDLLKSYENMTEPEPRVNKSPVTTIPEYLGVDGLPISKNYPALLPGELAPHPVNFFQEMENNDAIYRGVFERTPYENMGEILTPIISDYEEPKMDLEELFDLALIETDEQVYEENYLRHTMALAVFEDKSLEELKELLENIKRQPL